MARGDKNYSERTHKVADKGTEAKKKEVWDMVGAKAKLQDMVEALINGDSKAAAASLHDYLQVKTRSILGEMDDEEMVADEDGEQGPDGEGEYGEEDFDEDDFGDDNGEFDEDDFGEDDDDEDDDFTFEGDRGNAVADDASVRTRMHKNSEGAPELQSRIHGRLDYGSSARSGSHSSDSGAPKKTHMVKNSMGSEDLESRVDGDIDFDKGDRAGSKSSDSGAPRKTHMVKNSMGAPGLESKVDSRIKFGN